MTFTLAVTQAPHASYFNGGTDSSARQYFARNTQHTTNGPRIAAAISGMTPGEFRSIWVDSSNFLFLVRHPVTNGQFGIVDWTPRCAWDSVTQQIILGGRRGLTKLIAYSDITGEWRELPMPVDWGRIVIGTIHYYGTIDDSSYD